ncbi:receptor-like protein EIX2 [Quercus lobata]|uniref:receptor-like protein EIX2 n=1 Tax=Quercus lobata TaxID=97700 RepID=UPI001244236F|nr:receptor-like protein EIX2 [Quercus lobata]
MDLTVVFLFLSLFVSSSPLGIIKLSSCNEAQSQTNNVKCIHTEREALLSFKKGLTDPSGRLSCWVGEDCCQWRGIECNNQSGHVTKLDLRCPFELESLTPYTNPYLSGKISSSLIHLKYLNYLDLSLNDFEDIQIPQFFGMLENLVYLNLSYSYFYGEIPPHLGNLSSLMHLDLHGNYGVYAENLDWLSNLSSLKYLDLGELGLKDVGADWLQAINMLPSLLELRLSYCDLESLPPSLPFVNFTSLLVLDLSENQFHSSIPQWLFNLENLTTLDLSGNFFLQGQFPSFFQNRCKLKTLDLSWNNFDGNIDGFLDDLSASLNNCLESLDLSYNQLVGKIPDSLGKLGSLRYLNLENNSFWGSIPFSIGNLSSLEELNLCGNEMNGTIPESLGQLSELVHLYLLDNSWVGFITEAQLMNLTRLEEFVLTTDKNQSLVFKVTYDWVPPFRLQGLDLENCLIGPKFPAWLQVQNKLTDVTLKNIGISDTIPEEWFSKISSQLTYLDLSNNQITGNLPHQLVFPNVDFIDLSYNLFKGPIPLWFTTARQIYLRRNLFSGHIPSNIGDLMPKLETLDLSENYLDGKIPFSIQKMKDLYVLNLGRNQLSGELSYNWNESKELVVVDIGHNNLSGKIPSSMGCLSYLSTLVLSNNNLHGEIPSSLQNCSFVSIDLGGNNLSGNLPLWIGPSVLILIMQSNMFSGIIP